MPQLRQDYDIAVIGAGVVGVATALQLLMRGMKVVLLDPKGAGQETSYGNSGIIETSYVLPFSLPSYKRFPGILLNRDAAVQIHYPSLPGYIRWIIGFCLKSEEAPRRLNGQLLRPLVACALEEHKMLMQKTDASRYLSTAGRVKLHRSEASFLGAALERKVAQEWGVPFEIMDAEAFCAIEPSLNPVYYKAVRWTSSARLTNPGAVTQAYADRFVREGGVFQQTRVNGITTSADHSWSIATSQGVLITQQVVVCAGPWASYILKPLGYHFPLGIKRGYHQHFSSVGGAHLSHAIVDADIGYLICPMEQGYRITTGAEFASMRTAPNPVQLQRVLPYARELFPIGEVIDSKAWLGNRPCFTDSLPVIGAAPRHTGLWFNIGHGHSGLTIGPSSARLLAEMIRGEKTFCDSRPYRAERFSC